MEAAECPCFTDFGTWYIEFAGHRKSPGNIGWVFGLSVLMWANIHSGLTNSTFSLAIYCRSWVSGCKNLFAGVRKGDCTCTACAPWTWYCDDDWRWVQGGCMSCICGGVNCKFGLYCHNSLTGTSGWKCSGNNCGSSEAKLCCVWKIDWVDCGDFSDVSGDCSGCCWFCNFWFWRWFHSLIFFVMFVSVSQKWGALGFFFFAFNSFLGLLLLLLNRYSVVWTPS